MISSRWYNWPSIPNIIPFLTWQSYQSIMGPICALFIFFFDVNSALSQTEKTLMKWHENSEMKEPRGSDPGPLSPVAPSLLIHKESNFWCYTGWSFVQFKLGGLARSRWALVKLNVTHSSLPSNRCLCANVLKSLHSFMASSPFQHYIRQNDVRMNKKVFLH